MTRDRASLQEWYRQAMRRRIDELRDLRDGVADGEPGASKQAREVGAALRGSGATFGFSAVTAGGGLVESSPDDLLLRRLEGLVALLLRLVAADGGPLPPGTEILPDWLLIAAGLDVDPEAVLVEEAPWPFVARRADLESDELADRVAAYFDLPVADFDRCDELARRLVPTAYVSEARVVPLRQDAATITVATSDPTVLAVEHEIEELTSRRVVFAVADPDRIAAALSDSATVAPASTASSSDEVSVERTILVVDDDPWARSLARFILERGGFAVAEATDGVAALERIRRRPDVSLVVADLNMPRMDGRELILELRRERGADLPVIVMTGEEGEIPETLLVEEGADDYLRKPLDPRLFLARVEATVRRLEASGAAG